MLINNDLSLKTFKFRTRILGKNFEITTNSKLFETFIKTGFVCSVIPNTPNNLSLERYIFTRPEDSYLVYARHFGLIRKIMHPIQKRYWIFHASAFSVDGKATVLMGDSDSGKSMFLLVAGLLGAKVIGDEYVLVNKRTSEILPFRYFLKLKRFPQEFLKWSSNCKTISKQFNFLKVRNFILLNREDLNQIGIEVVTKKIPVEYIVFLENKKFDSALHLCKHCCNIEPRPDKRIRDLNKILRTKQVRFLHFNHNDFNNYNRLFSYVKKTLLKDRRGA